MLIMSSNAIELGVLSSQDREIIISQSDTEGESNIEDNIQLLPIDISKEKSGSEPKGISAPKTDVKLQKELTVYNSIAIVIGQIIGSGIFISSTQVLQYSGSFGLTLIFWTLGGLIAMGWGSGIYRTRNHDQKFRRRICIY